MASVQGTPEQVQNVQSMIQEIIEQVSLQKCSLFFSALGSDLFVSYMYNTDLKKPEGRLDRSCSVAIPDDNSNTHLHFHFCSENVSLVTQKNTKRW